MVSGDVDFRGIRLLLVRLKIEACDSSAYVNGRAAFLLVRTIEGDDGDGD